MANKLDLLAQKEQQLRQLNEQLDVKKTNLLNSEREDINEQDYDDYEESKQVNEDSYDDGFEDSIHKSKTIK